ncbi:MAG: alpha/beta fold hydrolase [Sphingomicrobium sp.]
MFLDLVRKAGEDDPELARAALEGLRAYQAAPRPPRHRALPVIARRDGSSLADHGGEGPPVVLVPSLINPPRILDLDSQVSLADAVARMGHHSLLLDWGKASERRDLSVAGHIEQRLLPLLQDLGEPPVLIGYCLGGTMAIAAASHAPLAGLVTLAAPWDFAAYPAAARASLKQLWASAEPSARELGLLPIEVLQAAFWSLDPERTVRKFARFAQLEPSSAEARRFVEMEEWANQGEPVPYPAGAELIEGLFGANLSGRGEWQVSGRPAGVPDGLPALHVTASDDRIVPAATAPPGTALALPSGHVGMVVGSARTRLHQAIAEFLALRVP